MNTHADKIQYQTLSLHALVVARVVAEQVVDSFTEITLSDRREAWTEYRDRLRAELARRWAVAEEEAYAELSRH